MTIEAKVVLDSVAPNGARLTTFELLYPRFIHSELMTHRAFARCAASSRAIPTPKKIERIRKDYAKPSEWGINVKGMQSQGALSPELAAKAEEVWKAAGNSALYHAEILCGIRCASCWGYLADGNDLAADPAMWNCACSKRLELDLHKQVANRILEPFDHIITVVSATKLKNHFKLRLETDPVTGRPLPDPTYFELATKWKQAYDTSIPYKLEPGNWHLPYVSHDDQDGRDFWNDEDEKAFHDWLNVHPEDSIQSLAKRVSSARCARTSYMRQGQGDVLENIKLFDRLTTGGHWSPVEHVATPIGGIEFAAFGADYDGCNWCGDGQNEGTRGVLRQMTYGDCVHEMLCMDCAYGHVHSGPFHGWKQFRKEFANEAGGD